MTTGRRGLYIWLTMMGIAIALVVLAGAATPALAATLLVTYLAMLTATMVGPRLRSLQLPKAPRRLSVRATPAAQAAARRAQSRPEYNTDQTLTDIGLIVNEKRPDGKWNRRLAQSVAMDEPAIQPYISVYVPPELSHRLAIIQFEVYDQAGRCQFSRQVEQWVRDGDNNVICDRQLPVRGNEDLGRAGVWDLRVSMDGALVALHSFNMNPASPERRRQFSGEGETVPGRLTLSADDAPLSLEELLREQREQSNGQ